MKKNLPEYIIFIALFVLLVTIPAFSPSSYLLHVLILTMMYVVLSSSLRLINLTGNLSLAHAGMLLLGSYVSAILVMKAGFSSWVALLCAGLFSAIFSGFLGAAFVKLKGIYFTMVTIFAGSIITLVLYQWDGLTAGATGIFNIPKPDPIVIPGLLNIAFADKTSYYFLILGLMIFCLVIMWFLEFSRIGMTFRAVQQSDSLSSSIGVNVTFYKVLAFALGCFFSGLMGGFYAQYIHVIDPVTFGFTFVIYTLIYMQVGGKDKFIGPLIGTIILSLLPEFARPLKNFEPFLFAIILVLVIFLMPEGLVGLPARIIKFYRKITMQKASGAVKK
jgi:branched-chain amino acid transport system permease protein